MPLNSSSISPQKIVRWFPLLIAAAGLMAWSNSFSCSFIFDDNGIILSNPRVHHLWPPWKAVTVPTRFVADISFAANVAISDFNAADFHMTNVLIHIVAGLLLYGVVRRTLRLPRFQPLFGEAAAPLALGIALIWLVHPLQTESVTYIVQRIEALMGMFFLLVLYAFIRSANSPRPGLWLAVSWFACLVGMGTKEVIVTAPVAVFLCDGLLMAGSWGEAIRRRWRYHLAMAATLIFLGAMFWISLARAKATGDTLFPRIDRWDYLLTQAQAILHYLRLSFIPTGLCLDYRWPIAHSLADVRFEFPVVAVLAAATVWGVIRRRPIAFPAACFFLILAPTSSVMPVADPVFEHRMYLPLAGVVALAVIGAYLLLRKACPGNERWRLVLPVLACLLVAGIVSGFVVMTRNRNLDYRTSETMWRDVLVKRPDNYRTYVSLSSALVGQNRPMEALDVCNELLRRIPDFSRLSSAEIERRHKMDRSTPAPEYSMCRNNIGAALLELNRYAEATSNFVEAVRVMPGNIWAAINLGKTFYFQRRYEEAVAQWQTVLQLYPDDTQTHTFLGLTYATLRKYPEAVRHYETVMRVAKDTPFVRAQLAWLLATCPADGIRNGRRAVELAKPLSGMSGDESPRALDILAAAYAEANDFDQARLTAEKALNLALRQETLKTPDASGGTSSLGEGVFPAAAVSNLPTLSTAIRMRLDLYRKNKSYIAPRED